MVSLTDSCHKRSQMSWQWGPSVWKVSVSWQLVRHEYWFEFLLIGLSIFKKNVCKHLHQSTAVWGATFEEHASGFYTLFCLCLSFRLGPFCNCSKVSSDLATNLCKVPGMDEPCSGRGDCQACGTCVCYNPDQYEGPYCQYDRTQCQRYGGFLCNGTKKLSQLIIFIIPQEVWWR